MNILKNLCIIVLLFVAISVFPQTTDTLPVRGNAPIMLRITIVNQHPQDFDLTTEVINEPLAEVREVSNDPDGFQLQLESLNSGLFVSLFTPDTLPYTLTYDGVAVDLSTGSTVITDVPAGTITPRSGLIKNLVISFDGASVLLTEGNYEDTLTFTIIGK